MAYQYDEGAFADRSESLQSARIIVPLVLDFVQPQSAVDVGCATGEFLSVFNEHQVKRILGVDGKWTNTENLQIPREFFKEADLERPLNIPGSFDLAVSLEVAEHLPEAAAETFVTSLTQLAPVVLFSAAIPFQEGLHHINEQWPSYWANLFRKKGYVPVDCLRQKLWDHEEISFWYAQNMLFFVSEARISEYPRLKKVYDQQGPIVASLVHPKQYLRKVVRAEKLESLRRKIPAPLRWIGKILRLY